MTDIMKGISPLPWKATIDECAKISHAHGGSIGNLYFTNLGRDKLPTAANAAYIVHACNLYPELVEVLEHAYETLQEINPSNYSHDDVCKLNDASVEVILALKPILAKCKAGA